MTDDQFLDLRQGDTVRAGLHGDALLVSANNEAFVIAIRTVTIPRDRAGAWDLVAQRGARAANG